MKRVNLGPALAAALPASQAARQAVGWQASLAGLAGKADTHARTDAQAGGGACARVGIDLQSSEPKGDAAELALCRRSGPSRSVSLGSLCSLLLLLLLLEQKLARLPARLPSPASWRASWQVSWQLFASAGA